MVEGGSELRDRIVHAAARLLTEGGREAVSTRAVSAAAGVQAPAIYRQFSDMRDLVHAAAREVLAGYVREKARERARGAEAADPVAALRRGWDLHVAFGLANPAAYALLYADVAASHAPEAREGLEHLTALVQRVAEAGRLRVSVPLAVTMIHAVGCGVTLTLIGMPPEARDPKLSLATREAVLAAILAGERPQGAGGAGGDDRVAARAVGLRAVLADAGDALSPGETALMEEWLDRLAELDVRSRDSQAAPSRPRRKR